MASAWRSLVPRLTAGAVVLAVSIVALVGLSAGVASGTQIPTPTPTAPPITPTPTPIADLPAPPPPMLEVTPASPLPAGRPSTLTATVNLAGAFPLKAGRVSFLDGITPIGDPVPVSGDGGSTATVSISTVLSPGTHRLSASLAQTDPFSPFQSRSPEVTYVVNPITTITRLTVVQGSPAVEGTFQTFTAMVAPPAAAGSVQFKDGADDIGNPVLVSDGTATTLTRLALGTHSLTAVFIPTDPATFSPSTSPAVTYVISPFPGSVATTTVLTVTPASPAVEGAVQTLTATVSPPAATGSVQFKDGANNIGSPVPVSNGTATETATLAVGAHSLTAVFTSTSPGAFASSTSAAVTYLVNAPGEAKATTTTLSVAPRPAFQGLPVLLFATVAPHAAAGTIQFMDGTTALGAPVRALGGGAFLITSTLAPGPHLLTAVFTPADPAIFGPSTSPPVPLRINPFPFF